MKQYIFRLLPLTTILLTACTIEVIDENSDVGGLVPINLTVGVDEPEEWQHNAAGTRAATTLLNNAFAENDQIVVGFSGNTTLGSNTTIYQVTNASTGATSLVSGQTQPYFTLDGNSTTAYGYYPSKPGSTFSVQTAQNTDANYKSSDLMYASVNITKSNGAGTGALTFSHKMAKIIVNITRGGGISSISAVKIVGGYRTINVTNTTNCTLGTTLTNANSSTNITVYSGNSTAATLSCAALIPPQTVSGNFLVLTTDQGDVTYSLDSKVFASGQSYTFNITVNAAAIGTTVAITNWSNNGNATVNPTVTEVIVVVPKAVDLGLSVKWANMNVGASSPTDYGLYFMWGDVAGHPGANTDGFSFNWKNYKWCNDTSTPKFTKYVPTGKTANWGGSGSPDNKLTLDAADDAATACWGSGWRMPTQTEIEELVNTKSNTTDYTWTWCDGSSVKYNNTTVRGWKIESKKSGTVGNHIFLPAAGMRYNTGVSSQGSFCNYWSSTLNTDIPDYAWNVSFNSSNVGRGVYMRFAGYTVRAVQSN